MKLDSLERRRLLCIKWRDLLISRILLVRCHLNWLLRGIKIWLVVLMFFGVVITVFFDFFSTAGVNYNHNIYQEGDSKHNHASEILCVDIIFDVCGECIHLYIVNQIWWSSVGCTSQNILFQSRENKCPEQELIYCNRNDQIIKNY